MTNKFHSHLKPKAESIRLTETEKSAMRARLEAAMSGAPAEEGAPAAPVRVQSPYHWMFAPRQLAVGVLAVLLIVSTSSAYAAEGSLPGGVLYPVKINLLEPIKVALATSPAAKAQVNADIATERVHEAQTLAVQGALTPHTAEEITHNYDEHAAQALALAQDADGATTTVTAVLMGTSTPPGSEVADQAASTTRSLVRTKANMAPHSIVVATFSAPTHASSTETLRDKLHATLEVQTKILDTLKRDARIGHMQEATSDEDSGH